jgi:hypothetical protein
MFLKDPDAAIDYRVDWAAALGGELSLASSMWTVAPLEAGGLTASGGVTGLSDTVARLSGGIAGHVYRVGNRVTFSDGSVDERSLVVRVGER